MNPPAVATGLAVGDRVMTPGTSQRGTVTRLLRDGGVRVTWDWDGHRDKRGRKVGGGKVAYPRERAEALEALEAAS